MKVFGKPLSEYIAFGKLFLILVPLAGIIRLVLSVQGYPDAYVQWVSMTALVFIGAIYFAIRVQTTGFGGYKELLVLCALENFTAQIISIVGILQSMMSGVTNIFTTADHSFNGVDPKLHILAHLFVGTIAGSLVAWASGSLVLFIARKVVGGRQTAFDQR